MSSKNGSQSPFLGLSSASAFARVYFDAWQNYLDAVNAVWGDVTAPDAKLGTVTSGWSRLLQAWTDGATDIFKAYTGGSRTCDEPVVTFVVDRAAECTNPRSVSVPSGVDGARLEWTSLRAVGAAQQADIDKAFLQLRASSVGNAVDLRLANLGNLDPASKNGTFVAVVYEGAVDGGPDSVPRRPVAVVVVTFVG